MKFKKKGDCDCAISKNDVLMAIGSALFAIGKAISVYVKFKKGVSK